MGGRRHQVIVDGLDASVHAIVVIWAGGSSSTRRNSSIGGYSLQVIGGIRCTGGVGGRIVEVGTEWFLGGI